MQFGPFEAAGRRRANALLDRIFLARPVQKARSPLDTGAAPGALAGCRVELLQRASRTPSCAKPGWCWAPQRGAQARRQGETVNHH